jgi:vacuolar-type H+-ATPase subunit E/Vma4
MTRETARRREEILAAARAEAERIVREARQRAGAAHAAAVAVVAAELAVLSQQGRERAEADAARGVFVMKDNVIRKALEASRKRLEELTAQPAFRPVLERLLAEALAAAPVEEPAPEPEPEPEPEPVFESMGTEPSVPEVAQPASPDMTPNDDVPVQEAAEAVAPREPNAHIVRVPEKHAAGLGAQIDAAGAQLALVAGPKDGVVVEDSWGTFRVTNTLSLRLARLEGAIRTEANAILFGREARQS